MNGHISKLKHFLISVVDNKLHLINCLVAITLICFLYSTLPVQANPQTPPKISRIGIYLTFLGDFQPSQKSFGANFSIWSITPFDTPKPLESLKILNSVKSEKNYTTSSTSANLSDTFKASENVIWTKEEISTTLHHNWDMKNYPFDRHVLQIILEETQLDTSKLIHAPDFVSTGYQKDMDLEGWKIIDFKISQVNFPYETRFGNPAIKTDLNYRSRLVVAITINRESKISFFKLSIGVYAAVALSFMALLLAEDFGDRMGIFVGTLFAVLVNMQTATSVFESSNSVTLIDFIHIIAIIYIFISAILLVYTESLSELGQQKFVRYLTYRIAFPILSGSFIIFNIVVIAHAMIVG